MARTTLVAAGLFTAPLAVSFRAPRDARMEV
jgi:hypothetical protein